jgi:hypothetical protein
MLFTRLASLCDNHDGPELTSAMILLRRNSPAGGLGGLTDDQGQWMRQNKR